jgi:hypothetical protein
MSRKQKVSPLKRFVEGKFAKTERRKSPSPSRKDFGKRAQFKEDKKSRCTYIHTNTGRRCRNLLERYPEYCEAHTILINNVYISKSSIPNGGNGLFVGPYGFKRGDIVGQYSFPWNSTTMGAIDKRCSADKCWSYVFCDVDDPKDKMKTKCWDGYDIKSTIMRNINDAYGSQFKNNAYFEVIKGEVYVVASKSIKPDSEILVYYGTKYF